MCIASKAIIYRLKTNIVGLFGGVFLLLLNAVLHILILRVYIYVYMCIYIITYIFTYKNVKDNFFFYFQRTGLVNVGSVCQCGFKILLH